MDLSQRFTPALPRKLSAPFRWHTTACEKVPGLSVEVAIARAAGPAQSQVTPGTGWFIRMYYFIDSRGA
jgi:hypothetical protein